MSVISQISDQASSPITDLRHSGVTGSGGCGGEMQAPTPGLIVSTLVLGFQICLRLFGRQEWLTFQSKDLNLNLASDIADDSKCGRASLLSLAASDIADQVWPNKTHIVA